MVYTLGAGFEVGGACLPTLTCVFDVNLVVLHELVVQHGLCSQKGPGHVSTGSTMLIGKGARSHACTSGGHCHCQQAELGMTCLMTWLPRA
jgi:hypothetical protein